MTKKTVMEKKSEVVDGVTIKYHANGMTVFSRGRMVDGTPHGYWEWYRPDGTRKRSGFFEMGKPVGEWITYDQSGNVYKATRKK